MSWMGVNRVQTKCIYMMSLTESVIDEEVPHLIAVGSSKLRAPPQGVLYFSAK